MSGLFVKRRLSANGIAYSDVGAGPAVILLHGVGLCSDVWLPQQTGLSVKFRIVSLDLPGHGGSVEIANSHAPSLDAFCELLEPAITEIESGPVILVGHSLGSLLAARLYERNRLQVTGLCMISCIFERSIKATQSVVRRAEEVEKHTATDLAVGPLKRWFGASPDSSSQRYVHTCRVWLEHAATRGYAQAYRVFAEQPGPSFDVLESMQVPALFITGEKDPNSTPAMSEAMATTSGAGVYLVQGAAHMLSMTHSEEVTSVLSEFCTGC